MASRPPPSSSLLRPRPPTRPPPPAPDNSLHPNDIHIPRSASPDSTETPANESSVLTPLRAHYLKKSLIQLQFNHELDAITASYPGNLSTFSYLGPPFTPPPKDAPRIDVPFLRYIFRQFVLTFPFMAAAPKDFYSEKLQPFMASALSRNLSPTSVLDDGDNEQVTRLKILAKLDRNLSLFVGSATKLVEREEVVRLSQTDLDRLEMLAKKRQARLSKMQDVFEVNIVCVRAVMDKGRVRSRIHEEFIIRTRRSNYPDVFVSRRHGDFKTLANELRKAHPEELVRPPPAKDRTTVTASTSQAAPALSPTMADAQSPLSPSRYDSPLPEYSTPSKLAREKNRLTLRSYLHSLMAGSRTIASSPVLKSFLLSGPTVLSQEELEDARRREEADHIREEGRKRFAKEIAGRVEGLREAVKSVKGDVMGKDGLTHIFATIKTTPDVSGLPENYKAVLEWARISLASTVFHHFVAADNSSEAFASLKRLHGLMPYFLLKSALKISNPIGMIRSVLDLFLAQPFGGRSLLQRMFTSSLTEEVKTLEDNIEAVQDKIDDPIMCEKVKQFVYAFKDIQELYKADAAAEKLNVLVLVLRSGDEPVLNRAQIQRVSRAHRAHVAYIRSRDELDDSDDDDGPQNEDAWLFEDLKLLTQLYSRLKDREQLIALIFEGFTAELLKDIITIFYAPLAQVYRAASIADSLSDMQNFVNDLIKTVEQVEALSQEDSHRTVQTFIDLIQRHEQAFYSFVHKVHSKGEGLFDSLMKWIELFLTVIREGLGDPISLEYLLPHTGSERAGIMVELDAVALYHYKLKVAYEDKLRKRFGKVQGQNDADAEDEATAALVNGVVGELSFGELVKGDAIDVAAEDTESSDDDSSEYESTTDDDDGESEESGTENSEESIARVPRPPVRSHTVKVTPQPSPLTRDSSHPPIQNPPRPRSISLKNKRSMTFSLPGLGHKTRHSADVRPPPVPALPKGIPIAALQKPLPPSPSPHSSAERILPTKPGLGGLPLSPGRKLKKRAPSILKPPDLEHIPKLLPVFTEMMRPLLRPRER